MKKQNILLIIYFSVMIFAFSACEKNTTENNQVESQSVSRTSPTPNATRTPIVDPEFPPISRVDFKNFAFPETNGYERFKLKNGEKPFIFGKEDGVDLFKTEYADLTGDDNEEAILTMSIQTGGSAIPNLIYIYTLKDDKPKLLWNFMTGDRADGGLKKLYVENGELIVELFGDSKLVNNKWSFYIPKEKYLGDGRPSIYTRNRFKWNGKKFVLEGKPELFDYDMKKETEKNQ